MPSIACGTTITAAFAEPVEVEDIPVVSEPNDNYHVITHSISSDGLFVVLDNGFRPHGGREIRVVRLSSLGGKASIDLIAADRYPVNSIFRVGEGPQTIIGTDCENRRLIVVDTERELVETVQLDDRCPALKWEQCTDWSITGVSRRSPSSQWWLSIHTHGSSSLIGFGALASTACDTFPIRTISGGSPAYVRIEPQTNGVRVQGITSASHERLVLNDGIAAVRGAERSPIRDGIVNFAAYLDLNNDSKLDFVYSNLIPNLTTNSGVPIRVCWVDNGFEVISGEPKPLMDLGAAGAVRFFACRGNGGQDRLVVGGMVGSDNEKRHALWCSDVADGILSLRPLDACVDTRDASVALGPGGEFISFLSVEWVGTTAVIRSSRLMLKE